MAQQVKVVLGTLEASLPGKKFSLLVQYNTGFVNYLLNNVVYEVICDFLFSTTGWQLQKLPDTYLEIANSFIEVKLKEKSWKVATIKIHLISLNYYLDFVNLGTSVLDTAAEVVKKVQRQIQLWNNYLQKLMIAEQSIELQIKDNGD